MSTSLVTTTSTNRHAHGWRIEAWRRFDQLRGEAVPDNVRTTKALDHVTGLLRLAEVEIRQGPPDNAWPSIHAVEEALAHHAKGDYVITCAIRAYEHGRDPVLQGRDSFAEVQSSWEAVKRCARRGVDGGDPEVLAAHVSRVLGHAHRLTDESHQAKNECHRRLSVAAAGLFALSGLVVVLAWAFSGLEFLVDSSGAASAPAWQLISLMVVGGMVGAALGAVPAYVDASSDRYRLRGARAAFRIALGVLSALVALSLLQAGWLTDWSADSAAALFAVALAFGAAQEPVTRVLESKIASAVAPEQPSAA